MIYYVIKNIYADQFFWSDKYGWVETDKEDRFTEAERNSYDLPIDGAWCVCFD